MASKSEIRTSLLQKGFFPEVLPPCFDSSDLKKGFQGMMLTLDKKKFHKNRAAKYIRYSGTKHDGNRRPYGTVNPIPYYNVCNFIAEKWTEIETKLNSSNYSLNGLRLGTKGEDRAIIVPTMSELTERMSEKIRFSPYIVKTDIAQFYPSIYTHTISWAKHGIDNAKSDRNKDSAQNYFNQLDWFIQQCQNEQTRGVVIGPDAFRVIAEFISCEIDDQLNRRAGKAIIGAIRHVDDFYIGVPSELLTTPVLSRLRDILQVYEFQLNDSKTKVISGLHPIDDIWAQDLRSMPLSIYRTSEITHLLDKAFELSNEAGSQSAMKLAIRRLDTIKCYKSDAWEKIENHLMRAMYHFPHCIDYICLLLVKRFALRKSINIDGWGKAASIVLNKNIYSNHHHEICWSLWVIFTCKLDVLTESTIGKLKAINNSHINAMLIAAYQEGLCKHNPKIKFGRSLETSDETWLENLVAKATGYTKTPFGGAFKDEFDHFTKKKVKLLNFKKHLDLVATDNIEAISRSKYGYDADDDDDDFFLDDWDE